MLVASGEANRFMAGRRRFQRPACRNTGCWGRLCGEKELLKLGQSILCSECSRGQVLVLPILGACPVRYHRRKDELFSETSRDAEAADPSRLQHPSS